MRLEYTIHLAPVTKKNHQQICRNAKTGRPFIRQSVQYNNYAKGAGYFLRPRPDRPIDSPCQVKCLFYMPTRRRVDLTNLEEAIDDILVECGILADDHCGIIVSHDGSRVLYDKEHPRTEIEIIELAADNA